MARRVKLFVLGVTLSVVPLLGAGILFGNHTTDDHKDILVPWVAKWDCAHTPDCSSTP